MDEEAAQAVRRIYSMTLEGYGTEQIAMKLSEEKILTPITYWREKGVNCPGKSKLRGPCMWNASTITSILALQEYCGDVLNFKTYSKSYKNKKRLPNDRENWAIFQDVHEPILERAVFEQVQQKRGKICKRCTHEGECGVGVIEIPELIPLPAPEVSVNTRKGVVVNYAPSTIAG